jgi:hypothetical protein
MRALVVAFALALYPATQSMAALLSTDELLDHWIEANGYCRGGSGDETMQWCAVRDGLTDVLIVRGWCYGKSGEAGYQMRWHKCGPDSNRPAPPMPEEDE